MKTATVISATLVLVLPLAACSGDRNKQVDEATVTEAEAARSEREAQVDLAKKQQDKAIEAQRPRTENLPEASQQRAKAESARVEDRQKLIADARARLQKVDARLDEARVKLQVSRGRTPTEVNSELERSKKLSASLSSDIEHLLQVSNDAWASETKRIDSRLDDLEKSASDVSSKAGERQ